MTSDADILRAARDVIWDPANWIKNAYAQDKARRPALPDEPGAVMFCSMGAVMHAVGVKDCHTEPALRVSRLLAEQTEGRYHAHDAPYADVQIFNDADDTTHADVMDLFDRAIKFADSGESA